MCLVWILIGGLLLILTIAFLCFYITFFVTKRQRTPREEFDLPPGNVYRPYHDRMIGWMKEVRTIPAREMTVTSFDGLTLHAKYYEYAEGAPVELMMQGYRGSAERDLCGGVQRCFALGHNVLVVDQRAAGQSEGHVITFGIKERHDCLTWVNHLIAVLGPDVRIILCGISMGGATVLMAAGEELPENVVGVLADCGYSSARAIIQKVMRELHLPSAVCYPFVKLGARIFGGFDLEETSPLQAVARCRVPVIFFHGEADDFVPCYMSRELFEACASPKKLHTVPGAGHGLAYPADQETYLHTLANFFDQNGLG